MGNPHKSFQFHLGNVTSPRQKKMVAIIIVLVSFCHLKLSLPSNERALQESDAAASPVSPCPLEFRNTRRDFFFKKKKEIVKGTILSSVYFICQFLTHLFWVKNILLISPPEIEVLMC